MRKKKLEFSKLWLICCITFTVIFTTASYILAAFDKQPLEALSSAIIDAMWGTSGVSYIGYAVQNCVRAFTASKFGIPKEEIRRERRNRNGDM